MSITKNYNKLFESSFIAYFTFMFLAKQLGYSSDDTQYKITLGFSCFFLFIKIFFDEYTKREWIIFALLITLSILSSITNGKIALLFTVLTIFSMRNISIKKLCKYILGSEFVVLGVNIMKYFMKGRQIENTVRLNAEGTVERITRTSFGFIHPNALHSWLIIVFSLIIYLNYKKINSFHYITMFTISLLFYSYDKSRTGLITSAILLGLAYFLPYIQKIKILRIAIVSSPAILSISTIALIKLYGNQSPLAERINILLMNRLKFASNFLYNYPAKLFGSRTVDSINGSIIDSGFAELYIRYGILFFLIIILFNVILCKKMLEANDYAALAMVIVFQFYNLTEPYGVNIFLNISYIFMNKYLLSTLRVRKFSKGDTKNVKEKTRIFNYGPQRA